MDTLDPDIRKVTNWTKFRLLFWKNWQIQRNRKWETIMIFTIVVLTSVLTLILRAINPPEIVKQKNYPSQSINELPPISILYSPKNNIYENLISTVSKEYEGISNARQLQEKLLSEDKWFAGVEFPDNNANIKELTKTFDVSLRFPPILRRFEGNLTWNTHKNFQVANPMAYVEEGFVQLQNLLFMAYLKSKNQNSDVPTSLEIQRYPSPETNFDPYIYAWILAFLIIYVYPGFSIITAVGEERETQMKEIMKILGVSNWLHWVAWFLKSIILLTIISALFILLFKLPIGTNKGIIHYSSWSFLLVLMMIFSSALIVFCFALTVTFKSIAAAHIAYTAAFIISNFILPLLKFESFIFKLVTAIIPFVALQKIVRFSTILEVQHKGLRWSHLFSDWPKSEVKVWQCVIMMLLSIFLFLILCLYFEQINTGEYGVGKKWYFPFQRRFWSDLFSTKKSRKPSQLTPNMNIAENRRFEGGSDKYRLSPLIVLKDKEEKKLDDNIPGLQIIKLHKRFHDFVAVKELTLDMYVDQITVLLGKNGAGKTTTILMLTGMIAPTSGTAIVNGYDIRTDLEASRQSLGICPQIDSIFNNLTVLDHIVFFCRLRGLWRKNDIKAQVDKYLDIMELTHKKSTIAKNLSGGMKRKLCLCCALTGNVKTVLCDEPSSGVDPSARRRLWQLLQAEKQGRTILLTTHFMDEADTLGDRIAILNDGELRCVGTPFDLKKEYGTGYILICDMLPDCDKDAVTSLLRGTSQNILLESERGTELTYRLPLDDSKNYSNLFRQLENNLERLRLTGFGISMTSMEEVFLRVNANTALSKKSSLFSGASHKFNVFDISLLEHTRWRIILQRLKGFFWKRIFETKREWILFLIVMLLPLLMFAGTFGAREITAMPTVLPSLKIAITNYDTAVIVLETQNSVKRADNVEVEIASEYEKYAKSFGSSYKFKSTEGKALNDYLLDIMKEDDFDDEEYVIAATIGPTKLIAWINSHVTHSAPLSLNYLHNAMARVFVDKSAEVKITNHPLPFKEGRPQQMDESSYDDIIVLLLTILLCIYVIYPVQDRVSGMKLQQMLSGVNIFIYWLTIFLWDFLSYLFIAFGMALLDFIFMRESSAAKAFYLFLILAFFGIATLPFIYILSQMFKNTGSALGYTIAINFILSIFAKMVFLTSQIIISKRSSDDQSPPLLVNIFRLLPHVSVYMALSHLQNCIELQKTCDKLKKSSQDPCKITKSCCDVPSVLDLHTQAIGWDLLILFISTILFLAILILCESQLMSATCNILCSTKSKKTKNDPDEDVLREKELIQELSQAEREKIPLVVDKISKNFGQFRAVHELSFAVQRNECFGLLGVNGAGKSTTFKMLTGKEFITKGAAYLEGYNIRTIVKKPKLRVGYCPQESAIMESLSARENFHIFCLWKGVKSNRIKSLSNVLALEFGFSEQIKKIAKHLSGGNKRKLCTAVSLIGNPKIIYLDEPSSGMDPLARHQMWEILISLRETGKPIVLTSHSMEECEALCTRLGIMVAGQLQCLGSSQYLKNKFSRGLILKIKMSANAANTFKDTRSTTTDTSRSSTDESRSSKKSDTNTEITPIEKVKQFVAEKIPNAELTEQYRDILIFQIPKDGIKISELFEIMENNMQKLNIEDYTISQTTLDEIFLEFAKMGKE